MRSGGASAKRRACATRTQRTGSTKSPWCAGSEVFCCSSYLAASRIILGLAAAVDWAGDLGDPSVGFTALVAVFGALGACLSAIQSLGRAGAGGRIPEHVASSIITITRPALGAAAALGVYAIAASGLLNISLDEQEAHLTILALAFAAGFSERLVLSAVGTATGGLERQEKG